MQESSLHLFFDWDGTITNRHDMSSHVGAHPKSDFWEPWIFHKIVKIASDKGIYISIGTHGGDEDPQIDTARPRIIKSLTEIHALTEDHIAPIAIATGNDSNKMRHIEDCLKFHGFVPTHNNDKSLSRYRVKTIVIEDSDTNASVAMENGALSILAQTNSIDIGTVVGTSPAHLLTALEIVKNPNHAQHLVSNYANKYGSACPDRARMIR